MTRTPLRLEPGRLALLEERLRREGLDGHRGGGVVPRPDPGSPVPLTPQQRQMWILDHLVTGTTPYVIHGALRLEGVLDVEDFGRACEDICRRHESLRTVFVDSASGPVQIVLDDLRPDLSQVTVEVDDHDGAIRAAQGELARAPFDLTRGPLFRVRIMTFGADDHAVVFAMHHIISDLWSMGVLMSDVMEAYLLRRSGLRRARPPQLQYPDFAAWQAAQATTHEKDLAYWSRTLAGSSSETGLVADRARGGASGGAGGSVPVTIPAELLGGVDRLAAATGTTRFMIFTAAFAAVLVRASGRDDLVIGTPVAGRPTAELESVIGYFVNTVGLRVDAKGDPSFRELLGRVASVTVGALDHARTPFEHVVQHLAPSRSLARNPLFAAMFSYQNVALPSWDHAGLRVRPVAVEAETAKFDVQLDLVEGPDHVWGRLVHNAELFSTEQATAWAQTVTRLLRGAVQDPDLPLCALPVVDRTTRRRVLEWSNGTAPEDLVTDAGVHERIERVARRHPDRVAVVCDGTDTTYAELAAAGRRLGGRLVEAGVLPGDRVALCLPTGVHFLEAMMACWHAGAAYVPLDPDWPAERIRSMLDDCEVRVVLGSGVHADRIMLPVPSAEPCGVEVGLPPAQADRTAYVIFTSGTTGRPKGAAVTHANLLGYLSVVPRRLGWGGDGESYLLLQQAVTDFGLTTILTALTTGGELRILRPDEATDATAVAAAMADVDHTKLVPSHCAALASVAGWAAMWPRRVLVLGGEAARPEDLRRLQAERRGRLLVNHYGPTETTIGTLTGEITEERAARGETILGTPLPGTRAYVVDPRGELVPPGVRGELYIAGRQVGAGYVGRPDLTDERFVPDPRDPDHARMYRTGDVVWWGHDGLLRFVGRVDDQIKLNGHRVELGEIELAVEACPTVQRASVCLRDAETERPRLVAYVTATSAVAPPSRREVQAAVAERLPGHMVPHQVAVVPSLPMRSNGKVDRSRLPWPITADSDEDADGVPPSTDAEVAMATAFGQVLGRPVTDVHTSFFDLGGDSIQAIHVVAHARSAGFDLSTRDVFEHQTVAALCAARPRPGAAVEVAHDPSAAPPVRWPVQERLRALGGRLDGYTHRVLLDLPEGATVQQLETALAAVVAHHRVLTARLDTTTDWTWTLPDEPPAGSGRVEVADVGEVAASGLPSVIQGLVTELNATVDPRRGENVRALMLDHGPGRGPSVVVIVHHLVIDAVSWGVVLGDLQQAWTDVAAGREPLLAPVPVSFASWTSAVADAVADLDVADRMARWERVLDGSVSVLPDPDVTAPTLEVVHRLDTPATEQLLRTACQAFNVGVEDLCLTALGVALSGRTPADADPTAGRVLVEVEGHGRETPGLALDLTRTVGWLTSVHPVALPVTRPPVGPDATALLRVVEESVAARRAAPGPAAEYGWLRYLTDEGAEILGTREAGVVYNHLGRVGQSSGGAWQLDLSLADTLRSGPGLAPRLTRGLHLNTRVEEAPVGPTLVAEWSYPAGTLEREEVENLAATFDDVLRALTDVATAGEIDLRIAPAEVGETIRTSPRRWPLPLSFPQLNNVLQPAGLDNPHHNVVVATLLAPSPERPDARLDVAALRASLNAVAQRHEILRTAVFADEDGRWRQRVLADADWPLVVVDDGEHDRDARLKSVREVIAEQQRRGFTMAQGRPVRSVLVRVDEVSWALVTVLHHIVIDPWGYSVLQRDLTRAYQAFSSGHVPEPVDLPLQYGDIAVWQQDRLAAGELAEDLSYWEDVLGDLPDAPTFAVPDTQRAAPPLTGFTHGFVLSPRLTGRVRQTARALHVTEFMLLLAAFDALVATYSGELDTSVTVPLAGRDRPESHDLVGYFINEVIVRTRSDWDDGFDRLVMRVRDGALAGQAHQEAPLRLVHGARPGLDPFRTMFNLVNYAPFSLDLGDLVATSVADTGEQTDDALIPEVVTAMQPHNLDLYLAMHERDGRLSGIWLYSPEVVAPEAMAAMAAVFPTLLELVTDDPHVTLGDLRRRVLSLEIGDLS